MNGGPYSDDGRQVSAVASGHELLKIIDHFQPDLVVLDIKIENYDGFELLKETRNEYEERSHNSSFGFRSRKGEIMAQAQNSDTVKVHYTGRLEDGTVFDSSTNGDPMQFTVGKGRLIPGFERAVLGMSPGESTTVKLPADKAYGPHRGERVTVVDRNQFPAHLNPQAGQQLKVNGREGQTVVVTVTNVSESSVTLDANHPLAGKDLTFDIELIEIV